VGSRASNRYQAFDQAQVERARLIRTAQRLGFSLGEIARLAQEYEGRDVPRAKKAELLRSRLAALDEQARLLRLMRSYLAAKLRWVEEGEVGASPAFPAPARQAEASAKLAAE
jgi:DNA-binding transcriptional MerR regulator